MATTQSRGDNRAASGRLADDGTGGNGGANKGLLQHDEARKSLRNERVYKWDGGWTVRAVHGRILSTEQRYAWQRELNLYSGQDLPEVLFGENSLEVRHDSSGVRVCFTALEALRAWNSLQLSAEDVRVQRSRGITARYEIESDYDFTYTNSYVGGTDIARQLGEDLPAMPDTSSPTARPATDLARGSARLRKPLCKCKGYGGRVPLVSAGAGAAAACGAITLGGTASSAGMTAPRVDDRAADGIEGPAPVPPRWRPSDERVDVRRLVASDRRAPLFYDNVDLYEDDMHECGMLMLRARVLVAENFIVAYQRYFLRVDGVRARVIDARYIIRRGARVVLRERTWNEGTWKELVGRNEEGRLGVSIEAVNDSVAAERLPPLREPVVEVLELPASAPTWATAQADEAQEREDEEEGGEALLPRREVIWERELSATSAMCVCGAAGGLVLTAAAAGRRVDCVAASTGALVWSRDAGASDDGALVLALSASPDTSDGGRLALGYDRGRAAVWRTATGEALYTFVVAPRVAARAPSGNRSSTAGWVEKLAWSTDGARLGTAAGRSVAMIRAADGLTFASDETASGSVTSIAFGGGGALAVGAYGQLRWVVAQGDDGRPALSRGASAVLCVAVSPDGYRVAMGCLDKTMRVYKLDGDGKRVGDIGGRTDAEDWVGFDAGVTCIAWSRDGAWLAAAGGTALVVAPRDLQAGDAPILCRTPGTPAPDCAGGTCGRFDAIAWQPSPRQRASILVGLEAGACKVHVFDVERTNLGFPRRCSPLATIAMPRGGGTCGADRAVSATCGYPAFVTRMRSDGEDDDGDCRNERGHVDDHVLLALSCGGVLSVIRVDVPSL